MLGQDHIDLEIVAGELLREPDAGAQGLLIEGIVERRFKVTDDLGRTVLTTGLRIAAHTE